MMKKLKFLYILMALLVLGLTSCVSEKDEMLSHETRSSGNEFSVNQYEWSESELMSLRQMEAVNDSIANLSSDVDLAETRSPIDVLNQVIILWADSAGWAQGFEYGYHRRNNNDGNIGDGLLYATLYSVLYSVAAYVDIIIDSMFNLPADPTTGYKYLEYATAKTYLNQTSILSDQDKFKVNFRKTSARVASAEPIKMASFHNATVRAFISSLNMVPQTSVINQVFSEDDLSTFNSGFGLHLYNNINYYYKGNTPPGLYIAPYVPNQYMAQVLNLYKQGLQNISGRPYSQAISDIDALCCEYSNIVASQISMDPEMKKELIGALHVAPASALLWTEIYGASI